ncbi:oligosaccharide flippase family protein [Enterobacteriaceae bacterium RIT697]|nr:oligosaccharide flippase family protein [Enterobacteriaceae bacterium RIT697]
MKENRSLKEVAMNLLNLSSINVLNLIVMLVTMPYLSRVLGAENCGYYFIFVSASLFATIITDYSTQITGVRQIAQNVDSARLQNIYANHQTVRAVFGVLACLLFSTYTVLTIPKISILLIVTYYVITLVGHYLTATWYHQGMSRLTCLAISTMITRAAQLAALVMLVKQPEDMLLAVFVNAFSYLITGICALWYRTTRLSINEKIAPKNLIRCLKQGWSSFVGDFAPNLYSNIPLLVIGSLVSPAVFASYSMAMRLVSIAGAIQLMMSKAAYPILAKGNGKFSHLMQLNIGMSLIPILLIFLWGEDTVMLFLGNGYTDVIEYLKHLSIGILLNGILTAYAYGYFLPNHHDRAFRNISIFVSVISAIIGYALIYAYSVKGAIAMFVFARMLFVICYIVIHRRLTRS